MFSDKRKLLTICILAVQSFVGSVDMSILPVALPTDPIALILLKCSIAMDDQQLSTRACGLCSCCRKGC